MTGLNSNHKITHEKLDLTREDIQKLRPILTLLDSDEQDRDIDFADRLFNTLLSLGEKMERQEQAMLQLSDQVQEALFSLNLLTGAASKDAASGFSGS